MYKSKHTSYEFGFYVRDGKYDVTTTAPGDQPISTYLNSFRIPKGEMALSHNDRVKLMVAELNPAFNRWFHTRNDIPCKAVRMLNQIPAFKATMDIISKNKNMVPVSYVTVENSTDKELLQMYIDTHSQFNKLSADEVIDFLKSLKKL